MQVLKWWLLYSDLWWTGISRFPAGLVPRLESDHKSMKTLHKWTNGEKCTEMSCDRTSTRSKRTQTSQVNELQASDSQAPATVDTFNSIRKCVLAWIWCVTTDQDLISPYNINTYKFNTLCKKHAWDHGHYKMINHQSEFVICGFPTRPN